MREPHQPFSSTGSFDPVASAFMQASLATPSPVQTGAMFLPMALAVLVCSPLSGRLVGNFGARPSLAGGGALMTIAAVGAVLLGEIAEAKRQGGK